MRYPRRPIGYPDPVPASPLISRAHIAGLVVFAWGLLYGAWRLVCYLTGVVL